MSTSSVGTGGSSAGNAQPEGAENAQGKKDCPPGLAKKDGRKC
jgi:hypothetical protein